MQDAAGSAIANQDVAIANQSPLERIPDPSLGYPSAVVLECVVERSIALYRAFYSVVQRCTGLVRGT